MKIKLLLIIPVILGFTYCSSSPDGNNGFSDTDISASVDKNSIVLENIRLLIEEGSLSSLIEASVILEAESAGKTEQGERLWYTCVNLLKLVYPGYRYTGTSVVNPKAGMLTTIVESAVKGRIIEIPSEAVNFFSLLLSSTSILYTDSDAVIERSQEILKTIYPPENSFFLPLYLQAYALEKQKLYKEALEGYRAALSQDKMSYPAELGISRILGRNEEYSEMLQVIENLFPAYGELPEVSGLYVDALIGTGKLENAQSIVSDLLTLNPDDMVITLKYADILQRQGQDSRALRILNVVESATGQTLGSIKVRAAMLIKQNRNAEALKLIKSILDKNQDDPGLKALYGNALLLTGNTIEGRDFLQNNIDENPENLGSLRLLTKEAIVSKEWDRAAMLVLQLLEKEDIDTNRRYAVNIFQNLGDYSRAIEYNGIIVNQGNPFASDYTSFVNFRILQNKRGEALEKTASWINSGDSSTQKSHYYYLRSLAQTNAQERLESLRQSLFENLQNLDAILAIADVYEELNEKRQAYRYLKQALLIIPGDEIITGRLRKLERELN